MMIRKIVLWCIALISLVIWFFPRSADKFEKTMPKLKTVADANLTQGDLLHIKNGKTVISEVSKQSGINPVVKILPAGTRLRLISRRALSGFKVELESGEIGYLNYFDIDELRNMVAKKEVSVYKEEKTINKIGKLDPGNKGRLIDIRNNSGTLVLKLEDGKQVFAGSNSGMGWEDSLKIDDLPVEDQSSSQGTCLTKNRLDNEFVGSEYSVFKNKLPLPNAYVKFKGDSARAYYNNVFVFIDNRIKKDLTVNFKNGIAQSYLLGKRESGTFFGSFPLSNFVANLTWPSIISQQFTYHNETYLDQLRGGAWYAFIISLFVSLVIMVLIFSIPYYLTFPFYYLFMRIKKLNNNTVTHICLGLMYVLYYLWFLTFFIHFDSKQPLIYFIICISLSVWYTIIIRGRIAYHRCPNCHTVYTASNEGTNFLGSRKIITKVTNNVYTGSSETNDTITHHYEKRSHDEVKIEHTYADKRKCQSCGYQWTVTRKETS